MVLNKGNSAPRASLKRAAHLLLTVVLQHTNPFHKCLALYS